MAKLTLNDLDLHGKRVLVRVDFKSHFTEKDYFAFANFRTSGLGALLKKQKIWALTTGEFAGKDVKPTTHLQQNMDKKNRRVEMKYGNGEVDIAIVPPNGSFGTPPATVEQQFNSDDTLSALVNMTMQGYRTAEEPCVGSVPVFDSKQHYMLRMERDGTRYIKQRGYEGDTIRCNVYYEPVAGFDPEDLPSEEEGSTPIKIYIANFEDAGVYIPVRMTYKISGFKAVVKAREILINKTPVSSIDYKGLDFAEQEQALAEKNLLPKK